jgi:hypothetical protein
VTPAAPPVTVAFTEVRSKTAVVPPGDDEHLVILAGLAGGTGFTFTTTTLLFTIQVY